MDIDALRRAFLDELARIRTLEDLEDLRVKYLGRKGAVTQVLRSLKDRPLTERQAIGPAANRLRDEIEEVLKNKVKELIMRQEAGSVLDATMPGQRLDFGHLHPLTLVERRVREIFLGLNFSAVEGPELETEYYNFDALNMPPHHPARDAQDTIWIDTDSSDPRKRLLLRTQTSPMQIRYLEQHQPPLQIIVPGRVFRNEATDASHEMNFYQVEGLMVGREVSLANLKFVIAEFFKKFFHQPVNIQLRPSYFPFVEPGLEVAIKLENSTHWLEVMGAGMVHPKVFAAAGCAPGQWQGFAFGIGLDRLAMLKYKIPDIRLFYSGDLRFISQF